MADEKSPKETDSEQNHQKAETERKPKESQSKSKQRKVEHQTKETEAEHKNKTDLIRPGNEEYLSYYKLQQEWKPTRPVGAIGAMCSSPGPAIVNLPASIGDKNHDPRKYKAPAFTIGLKDDKVAVSEGTGPGTYNVSKITNKGLDVCHAPFIGESLKGLTTFASPGPAAYNRGSSDRYTYPKIPAYTMRPKIEFMKGFVPPAPTSYTLPGTLGPGRSPFKKSPCYTMGERSYKTGIFQKNPGPAAYQLPSPNVQKPKAPAFSIRTREQKSLLSKTGITSPGPASNYRHMVKYNKPATPRYTFGIRHTPFEAFQRFAAEN